MDSGGFNIREIKELFKVTELVCRYDCWSVGLQISKPSVSRLKQRQKKKKRKVLKKRKNTVLRKNGTTNTPL